MGVIRATAVAGLGVVALAGAAVAGVERAWSDQAAPPAALGPSTPAAPTPQVVAVADPGPPCAPVAVVCVRLASGQAWLAGGLGPVPVSVGGEGSPTPVGAFTVESKRADHVSSIDGTPMPFAVFFAGDVALYEGDVTEPSEGSVRLPPGSGAVFFDAHAEGDAVHVVP